MRNLAKSILIIGLIALLQLSIYGVLLKPVITTWGASEAEVSMPMAGDDKNLTITATRAISIDTSKSEVWKWLVQLGADRGGFYSYSFIEEALGYESRRLDAITPEFKEIKVGDLVRGSIDEKKSIAPYNFQVLYVKPGESFVLDNWGTFLLTEVNSQQTRLVIRSQESASKRGWSKFASYIEVPLHFVMERRLLMGIKARAEAGENVQLSQTRDVLWFAGIVLSGLLICFLIYTTRGIARSVVLPSVLSFFWMCSILLAPPMPLYGMGMLLIVIASLLGVSAASKTSGASLAR